MDTNLAPLDALTSVLEMVSARMEQSDWSGLAETTRAPFEAINAATLPTTRKGTLKAWMSSNHGKPVYTLQVGLNGRNPWAPGARSVDAKSSATYVYLDGSAREYAGSKVVAASDDVLIIATSSQVAMYIVA